MGIQEFIDKWGGTEVGYWVETPCALFWARSYRMPIPQIVEMAKDYLALPISVTDRAPCSYSLAQDCVGEEMKKVAEQSRELHIIPETIRTVDGKPPTPEMIEELNRFIDESMKSRTEVDIENGKAIKKLRHENGLFIRETAIGIGIKPSELLKIESGQIPCNRAELEPKIRELAFATSNARKIAMMERGQ